MSKIHEVEVTIKNSQGLHARPAKVFVENANKFESEIEVFHKDAIANGKSIMSLLGLLAFKGCTLKITAVGEDAAEAVSVLAELINNKFNLEENN